MHRDQVAWTVFILYTEWTSTEIAKLFFNETSKLSPYAIWVANSKCTVYITRRGKSDLSNNRPISLNSVIKRNLVSPKIICIWLASRFSLITDFLDKKKVDLIYLDFFFNMVPHIVISYAEEDIQCL